MQQAVVFYRSPLVWRDNFVYNETIKRSKKATCHAEERLILQKASRGDLQERILSIGGRESRDLCVDECQLSARKAFTGVRQEDLLLVVSLTREYR
jgi:hypothetical protein